LSVEISIMLQPEEISTGKSNNFLTTTHVEDMDREQLEIRAMRLFLDVADKSNLEAVPDSFEELDDIEEIVITGIDLRVIPECINYLTGLLCLRLSTCTLNHHTLPFTLFQLTSLQVLKLEGNELASIPYQIEELSSLIELNLSFNEIVNIPDELYQLTSLVHLDLQFNRINWLSPQVGDLVNLRKLWIDNNQLQIIPKEISKLIYLEPKQLHIHAVRNRFKSLPDSIRKVMYALNDRSREQYRNHISVVYQKAEMRIQRRLVILLAKVPAVRQKGQKVTRRAGKEVNYQLLTALLKERKVVHLIVRYMN